MDGERSKRFRDGVRLGAFADVFSGNDVPSSSNIQNARPGSLYIRSNGQLWINHVTEGWMPYFGASMFSVPFTASDGSKQPIKLNPETGALPITLANGSSADISLADGNRIPFTLADGSISNISLG